MKHTTLLILLLVGCTQPHKKQNGTEKKDTSAALAQDTLPVSLILKDTFNIAGNRFRLLSSKDSFYLDQWKNNKWQLNLVTDFGHGYDRNTDYNLDGYPDFTLQGPYFYYTFLFSPDSACFHKKFVSIATENQLYVLDSTQKIFCNNWWTRSAAFSSDLYTFVADTPYVFYKYEVIAKAYPNQFDVKKIVLYQCKNGNRDSALFIRNLQPGEINRDDFRFFWQKNWHKLLQR